MLGRIVSVFVCVGLWLPTSVAGEAKVQKLTFGSGGATRSYWPAAARAPSVYSV